MDRISTHPRTELETSNMNQRKTEFVYPSLYALPHHKSTVTDGLANAKKDIHKHRTKNAKANIATTRRRILLLEKFPQVELIVLAMLYTHTVRNQRDIAKGAATQGSFCSEAMGEIQTRAIG